MCRVGIHARMPHCEYRDGGRADGQFEGAKAVLQLAISAKARAWHEGDQIRIAGDAQCVREPRNDGNDGTLQTNLLQRIVDGPGEASPA